MESTSNYRQKSAEIKRGKYKGKYTASTAQNKSERRRSKSHKHAKWRNVNLLHFIERRLKKRWSPEIIAEEWRKFSGKTFTHTSIYTVIKKHRPEWRKLLIHRGKRQPRIGE